MHLFQIFISSFCWNVKYLSFLKVTGIIWVYNFDCFNFTGREHVKTHICAVSVWRRKFSLIILWIPVNCPAIVIMLASDLMIAVLTTNTFVQVKVFSFYIFPDYLLMNTADLKLIKYVSAYKSSFTENPYDSQLVKCVSATYR